MRFGVNWLISVRSGGVMYSSGGRKLDNSMRLYRLNILINIFRWEVSPITVYNSYVIEVGIYK